MTGTEALLAAARRFTAAGIADAGRDARWLLAHALGVEPGRLTLILPEEVGPDAADRFAALVAGRIARQPVSHLTGKRAFYGRDFHVTGDVLDPRPDTETLVEVALSQPFAKVLDLGTGSGCILVTLLAETPQARGTGLDISAAAIAVATENARRHGVLDRARFAVSDWMDKARGSFDLIVSNPPYIARDEMPSLAPEVRDWEPRIALTDEGDGLSAYRAILSRAGALLAPGGRIIVEIGAGQGIAVPAIAAAAGFGAATVVRDLDGRDRVVVLESPQSGA